jgi:hypothetical protein
MPGYVRNEFESRRDDRIGKRNPPSSHFWLRLRVFAVMKLETHGFPASLSIRIEFGCGKSPLRIRLKKSKPKLEHRSRLCNL